MALTADKIRSFLSGLGINAAEVGDETLLFSSGLLDSFTMVELIGVIEAATGKRVPASQVTLTNFDSVERILRAFGKENQ
ncbi:MAG: acyl carrier protein [Planctomyces sp.]|nr:acyl carrier protein [Planctomyces sp.]